MTDRYLGRVRVGRNFIRVDDIVRVLPSRPGRRDGFLGTVRAIVIDENGSVKHVEVMGGPNGRPRAFHALRLERIARVAQTKAGERLR